MDENTQVEQFIEDINKIVGSDFLNAETISSALHLADKFMELGPGPKKDVFIYLLGRLHGQFELDREI